MFFIINFFVGVSDIKECFLFTVLALSTVTFVGINTKLGRRKVRLFFIF